LLYDKQSGKKREKSEENNRRIIIIINYCDVLLFLVLHMRFVVHTSLVLYLQNVSIDYMCQLPWRPLSFSFSLLIPHRVFHLIAHPQNFLIRFAGRTREIYMVHSAVCCFFVCERASRLSVFCTAVVLLSFFFVCIAVVISYSHSYTYIMQMISC
jgi:hypothetical protein